MLILAFLYLFWQRFLTWALILRVNIFNTEIIIHHKTFRLGQLGLCRSFRKRSSFASIWVLPMDSLRLLRSKDLFWMGSLQLCVFLDLLNNILNRIDRFSLAIQSQISVSFWLSIFLRLSFKGLLELISSLANLHRRGSIFRTQHSLSCGAGGHTDQTLIMSVQILKCLVMIVTSHRSNTTRLERRDLIRLRVKHEGVPRSLHFGECLRAIHLVWGRIEASVRRFQLEIRMLPYGLLLRFRSLQPSRRDPLTRTASIRDLHVLQRPSTAQHPLFLVSDDN